MQEAADSKNVWNIEFACQAHAEIALSVSFLSDIRNNWHFLYVVISYSELVP